MKSRVRPWFRMLVDTHAATKKLYHSGRFAGENAQMCTNEQMMAFPHKTRFTILSTFLAAERGSGEAKTKNGSHQTYAFRRGMRIRCVGKIYRARVGAHNTCARKYGERWTDQFLRVCCASKARGDCIARKKFGVPLPPQKPLQSRNRTEQQ